MALVDVGNGEIGGRGNGGGVHVVQVNDSEVAGEISPLLVEVRDEPPKMTIFSVSYARKRPPKETNLALVEAEVNFLSQICMWTWGGSKYSGLLCMASSSTIYYIMEVLLDIFPASIGAKIILHEKLAFSDIGGLSLSYLGVLFVFKPTVLTQGNIAEAGDMFNAVLVTGGQTIYAVLLGLFSSFLNGICYCLIRAAAKAADHPVYTVFSFGLIVTPLSAICTLTLQKFVLPNIFTFFLMVVLGVLAFLAEISLARGLQLEKICKVTNMIYLQVILSLAWSVSYLGASASFNKLIGCLLILGSVCCTLYFGPEKEPNSAS